MFTRRANNTGGTGELLTALDDACGPGEPIDPTAENIALLVDLCRQSAKAIRQQVPSPQAARATMGKMLEEYGRELQQNSAAG